VTTARCVACGDGDAALPLAVCAVDRDDVRRSLVELAEWYDSMLIKPSRGKSRVGKGHEAPSPMNERVAAVREQILVTLLSWIGVHAEQVGGLTNPARRLVMGDASSLVPVVSYLELAGVEGWLLAGDMAADYTHEVQRLTHEAERTAAPGRRDGVIIGVHEADDCDQGNVWASHVDGTARCQGCGRREHVAWWREQWPEGLDDLLTDAEACTWLAITYGVIVTPNNLWKWRHRELLAPADEKKYGRIATARGELIRFAGVKGWDASLAV
jgi:hypothetical protein